MLVKAVVPIKLNSARLPNKNIKTINGKSLVEWVVGTLNKLELDSIIVYCSKPEISEHITSPHTLIQRPAFLDEDDMNIKDIMQELLKVEHADIWIILHATSPFIKAETIQDMLDKVKRGIYHSAFSVVRHQKYAWYMGEPLNFRLANIGFTQTTEPIYIETSGPFVFYEDTFKRFGKRVSTDPYMKVVSQFEGVDIDTPEDFELAKLIGEHHDH